jgi:hypothetical protein
VRLVRNRGIGEGPPLVPHSLTMAALSPPHLTLGLGIRLHPPAIKCTPSNPIKARAHAATLAATLATAAIAAIASASPVSTFAAADSADFRRSGAPRSPDGLPSACARRPPSASRPARDRASEPNARRI